MPTCKVYLAIFMLDDGHPAHRLLPWRLPAFQEALRCRKPNFPWDLKVPPEGLYPASDKDLAPGLTRQHADKIRVVHEHLCQLTTKAAKMKFLTNMNRGDMFEGRNTFEVWFKRLWNGSLVNNAIDSILTEALQVPRERMDGLGTALPPLDNQIARYMFGEEAILIRSNNAVLNPHYYTAVRSIVVRARSRLQTRSARTHLKKVTLVEKAPETSKQGECRRVGSMVGDEQPVVAVEDGVGAKVQSPGTLLKRLTAPGDDQVSGERKRCKGDGARSRNIWVPIDTPTRTLRPRPQPKPEIHPLTQRSTVNVSSKSQACILSDSSDDDRASTPLLRVVDWAALPQEMRSWPDRDDSMDLSTMKGEEELRSKDENEVEAAGEGTPMPASAELVPREGRGRGWLQTVLSSSGDKGAGGEAGATCSPAMGGEPKEKTLPREADGHSDSDGEPDGLSNVLQRVTLPPERKLFLNSETEGLRQTKSLELELRFMLADDHEIEQAFEVWAEAHRYFPVTFAEHIREWPFPPFPMVSRWLRDKWPGIKQSDYNRLMLTVLDRKQREENGGGSTDGRRGE